MFQINLKSLRLAEDVDLNELVDITDGYSGADIASVCREAAYMPMRRLLAKQADILSLVDNAEFKQNLDTPITQNDLMAAINNISKSVSKSDLEGYDKWTQEFKCT